VHVKEYFREIGKWRHLGRVPFDVNPPHTAVLHWIFFLDSFFKHLDTNQSPLLFLVTFGLIPLNHLIDTASWSNQTKRVTTFSQPMHQAVIEVKDSPFFHIINGPENVLFYPGYWKLLRYLSLSKLVETLEYENLELKVTLASLVSIASKGIFYLLY
jgi:hypothetical protein